MTEFAHHLEDVLGRRRHVSLAIHLPQSPQPGLVQSQTIQGSGDSFRVGLTPATFPPVRSSPVSFSGSQRYQYAANKRTGSAQAFGRDEAGVARSGYVGVRGRREQGVGDGPGAYGFVVKPVDCDGLGGKISDSMAESG